MKPFILTIVLISLLACQSQKHVNFESIIIDSVILRTNTTKDSILLDLTYSFPPKSIGKKAILIVQPQLINKNDTIKFCTWSHQGEKIMDDCCYISYKTMETRRYRDSLSIKANQDLAKMKFEILFYRYCKNCPNYSENYMRKLDISPSTP